MMIKRTGRAPGMGIRAYIALGLTVMTLLFTASFFYFMSKAREVSVSGTRTYGLFMPKPGCRAYLFMTACRVGRA